jgi:hypothetical protein
LLIQEGFYTRLERRREHEALMSYYKRSRIYWFTFSRRTCKA